MNMQSIKKPEEDAQTELQEHPQAYILYRLRFMDFEDLGHKSKHGQSGGTRADQIPKHKFLGGCDGILASLLVSL
jgi:hypothetical protein